MIFAGFRSNTVSFLAAGTTCALSISAACAQPLSIDQPLSLLLRETDNTYFPQFDFEFVTSIRSISTTPDGGFLVNAKTGVAFGDNYTFAGGSTLIPQLAKDHIYGDVDGQVGTVLQEEDLLTNPATTISNTDFFRVEFSNLIGYNAANGKFIYGADLDTEPDAPTPANRISSIFVGNTPSIVEGDALPTGNGFTGATSGGLSFVGSSGDTAFYKASYTTTGVTDGSGLFTTADDVLLYTGQSLGASGNSIQDKAFAIGNTSISDNGAFFITDADVGVGSSQGALVINGQVATTPTGTFFREGDPIVSGGTELLSTINQVSINNSGKWAASGWTNAATAEDAIFIDGEAAFREGDILQKIGGGTAAALGGLPQYTDVNNDGDVAFYFGSSTNSGAIVLNGTVIVEIGDLVDGDVIEKFAVSPIALSDRDANGVVDLYFEAVDDDAFDSNSFGVYHVAVLVPEPTLAGPLALFLLACSRRRRV